MPDGWEQAAKAGWDENPVAQAALSGGPAVPGACLGQVAYEAYFEASNGRSLVSGAQLPVWGGQDPDIQQAWDCAAHAVARVVQGG